MLTKNVHTYMHTPADVVDMCTFCIIFPVSEAAAAAAATAATATFLSPPLCNINPQRPVF